MKHKPKYHIGVAGNIGAGKTTLTASLATHYGWMPLYENVDNNPYLFDFYEDMTRWSFNLQIFFLQSRLKQHQIIQQSPKSVIQDRTIYEDAEIFARNLFEMKLLSNRDFKNYFDFYAQIITLISPPDILIYLRSSIPILVDHINQRGRKYEENIRIDYLKKLNEQYERWIESYQKENKVIIVDLNEGKPQEDEEVFASLIGKIDAHINGLF